MPNLIFGDYNYNKEYSNVFMDSLEKSKGGLLLFLILITVVYNVVYARKEDGWFAATYLFDNDHIPLVLKDAFITGLFGVISTALVLYVFRRGDSKPTLKTFVLTALIIFTILFCFNVAQEGSGLNRYLDRNDILDGNSEYSQVWREGEIHNRAKSIIENPKCKNIAKVIASDFNDNSVSNYLKLNSDLSSDTECLNNRDVESGGDPFLKTLGYTSMIIIFCVVVIYILRMLKSTWAGYKSGNHSISKIKFFNKTSNKYNTVIFILETLFIVGLLNIIPPALVPTIRKERFKNSTLFTIGFILVVACTLHVMLQYNGMYKK
jgi:hypothetical protein